MFTRARAALHCDGKIDIKSNVGFRVDIKCEFEHYVRYWTSTQLDRCNMVNNSFTARMLTLYSELMRLGAEFEPMPDDAMDSIMDAAGWVRLAIIEAPVTHESDVANKLRLAAMLVEHAAGEMPDEMLAITRTADELAAFRNAEWTQSVGRPHPVYG